MLFTDKSWRFMAPYNTREYHLNATITGLFESESAAYQKINGSKNCSLLLTFSAGNMVCCCYLSRFAPEYVCTSEKGDRKPLRESCSKVQKVNVFGKLRNMAISATLWGYIKAPPLPWADLFLSPTTSSKPHRDYFWARGWYQSPIFNSTNTEPILVRYISLIFPICIRRLARHPRQHHAMAGIPFTLRHLHILGPSYPPTSHSTECAISVGTTGSLYSIPWFDHSSLCSSSMCYNSVGNEPPFRVFFLKRSLSDQQKLMIFVFRSSSSWLPPRTPILGLRPKIYDW